MPQYPHVIAALTRLAGELEDEAEGAPPEVAVTLLRRVLVLRKQADELRDPHDERLTVKQPADKLPGVEHTDETRAELSKRFSKKRDPNMEAARAKGIPSLRALAKALGCSASFLSQVAAGDRPLPPKKAEAFKKLTGKDWQ